MVRLIGRTFLRTGTGITSHSRGDQYESHFWGFKVRADMKKNQAGKKLKSSDYLRHNNLPKL